LLLLLLSRRWFCNYACPAGLLQDLARPPRVARSDWELRLPRLGPWAALITLGGAVAGYPLLLWLDPMSIFAGFANVWRRPLTIASLAPAAGLPLLVLSSWLFPRLWCSRLCPLGALQDIVRRLAQLGRRRSESANLAGHGLPRRAIVAMGAGAVVALTVRDRRASATLRPPGSVSEAAFPGLCIRCGNCGRACPSAVIRPQYASVAGFMTPHLRFDSDYCREDCSRCGQACPTGAIQRLDLASKRRRIIGIARLDADTCIMAEGRECGLCKARCPYDAIALRTTDGGFTVVPAVIATACIGCGACQAVCPVSPTPAIRVSERATV